MVKNLQRVPLEVSIHWCYLHYLHQDAEKPYSEKSILKSKMKSSIQKQIFVEI